MGSVKETPDWILVKQAAWGELRFWPLKSEGNARSVPITCAAVTLAKLIDVLQAVELCKVSCNPKLRDADEVSQKMPASVESVV